MCIGEPPFDLQMNSKEVWGYFLMSEVRMLHFLKDWWKFIQIHQYYTMTLYLILLCACQNITTLYFQLPWNAEQALSEVVEEKYLREGFSPPPPPHPPKQVWQVGHFQAVQFWRGRGNLQKWEIFLELAIKGTSWFGTFKITRKEVEDYIK